jgi:hypothetical protein
VDHICYKQDGKIMRNLVQGCRDLSGIGVSQYTFVHNVNLQLAGVVCDWGMEVISFESIPSISRTRHSRSVLQEHRQ